MCPSLCLSLFRLDAVIASFLKISLSFLFIRKRFQFFLTVLVIFGRNRLYVITRGILTNFFRVFFRNKVDSVK